MTETDRGKLIEQASRDIRAAIRETGGLTTDIQALVEAGWRPPRTGDEDPSECSQRRDEFPAADQPSYDAVYALIREWRTTVTENARIWRAVSAALDAMPAPPMPEDASPDDDGCGWKQRYDTARNEMLRELLTALGDDLHARPETPRQVWEEALERVYALATPVQQDTDPSPAELGFVRMMTRLREVADRPRPQGDLPMVNAKQIIDLGDPHGLWSTSFAGEVGTDG